MEPPRKQVTPEQREYPVSAYEHESELIQEPESETESVISDTKTDITTIISTTSTCNKYKLADLAWDTTNLDEPNPKEVARHRNCLLNLSKVVAKPLPKPYSFKKGCCQLQAKVCARITG